MVITMRGGTANKPSQTVEDVFRRVCVCARARVCVCVCQLQLQRCEYTMQAARPRGRLGSNGSAAIVDARLQLQNPWLQLQNIRLQL